MANNTFKYTVNKVNGLAGQLLIGSDSDFENDAKLGKSQFQNKQFVDLANRLLVTDFNRRALQRVFSITTNTTSTSFSLNSSTSVESLIFGTFFNVTVSGLRNGRLPLMNYDAWQSQYPDPAQYARGIPEVFVPMPDDGTLPHKIILWPYPDAVYLFNYRGKLDATPLTTATQEIVWPVRYEHILWMAAWKFYEMSANQGRAADMEIIIREAISSVFREMQGAAEDNAIIDLGLCYGDFGGSDEYPRRDYLATDDEGP